MQGLFQSTLITADYALFLIASATDSLITWTVVYLTTAKFKPLILSMLGFTLSNIFFLIFFIDLIAYLQSSLEVIHWWYSWQAL
jgi:hypothetical protein